MKKTRGFLLAAGVLLAMSFFTLSCSSGDDGSDASSYVSKGNDISNYRTVTIGSQVWMAENLDYEVPGNKCYGEGGEVLIDFDENNNPVMKTLSDKEVQDNCKRYGRLYDWATAMNLPLSCNDESCSNQIQSKHRGICPSGWHIPSNEEWETLSDYVQSNSGCSYCDAAKLKAASGWYDNGNGTDDYGFLALPGGQRRWSGSFSGGGKIGYWWSASEDNTYKSIRWEEDFTGWKSNFTDWNSVRCLQD